MKENVLRSFLRDTYRTSSPVPFIITGQIAFFVLLHIFELLAYANITSQNLYLWTYEKMSLPPLGNLFFQPWALFTHPFIYTDLVGLIFDCLWLYWLGQLFLNLLGNRQFLTVFIGGLLLGGVAFSISPLAANSSDINLFRWNGIGFGLVALVCSLTLLAPQLELRLLLFGNVKFRLIAILYVAAVFVFNFKDPNALVGYIMSIGFGLIFMWQLQSGNDWSRLFKKRNKSAKHLKVVSKQQQESISSRRHAAKSPSQHDIDQILDKISQNGYESLTSQEKEVLFRASKQDQ